MSNRDNFFARVGTVNNINAAMASGDQHRILNALKNPEITTEHINMAMNSGDNTQINSALQNSKIDPSHIDKVIASKNMTHMMSALKNPNITNDQLTNIAKNRTMGKYILANKDVKPEHIDAIFANNPSPSVLYDTMSKSIVQPRHIHQALNIENAEMIRDAASKSQNASVDNLRTAMNDPSSIIRGNVMYHPKANRELIQLGLKDKSSYVKNAAMQSKHTTKDDLNELINDPEMSISAKARLQELNEKKV